MSESKATYILQKDLPDAKAGAEFVFDGQQSYEYNFNGVEFTSFFNKEYVENNPEWFKEKSQPPVKRIAIEYFNCNNTGKGWSQYNFGVNTPQINVEQEAKIKKAIEFVLNPEPENKKEEGTEQKEYGILEGIRKGDPHEYSETCEKAGCRIHSIKRLSDNEVFTVGDKVKSRIYPHTIINSFDIIGNMLSIWMKWENSIEQQLNINLLQKV